MKKDIRLSLQALIMVACLLLNSIRVFGQNGHNQKINLKFSIVEDQYSRILLRVTNLECDSIGFITKWFIDDPSRTTRIEQYYKNKIHEDWEYGDGQIYFEPFIYNGGYLILPPKSYITILLRGNSLRNIFLKYKIRTICASVKQKKFFLQEFETNTIYISEKKEAE